MGSLLPQRLAAGLQPQVQLLQGLERRRVVPEAVAGIQNRLLDLPFLPAGSGVAELGLVQIVTHHGVEPPVNLSLLATAHLVDSGLHIVVDTALRDTAEGDKGVVVGVEQHLVGLGQVGTHEVGTAVAELEVGDLQLGADAVDLYPVLAPVELEGLARGELQGHIGLLGRLQPGFLLRLAPLASEGCHTIVGAGIAEVNQILVQAFHGAALLAVPSGLPEQPVGQRLLVIIQFAGAFARRVAGFELLAGEVFADRVSGQPGAAGDLPDRHAVTQVPASNYTY